MKLLMIFGVFMCFFQSAIFGLESIGTNSTDKPTVESTPCVRGVKIGQILVLQPNMSTVAIVGASVLIQWQYSALVKLPPKKVDIRINLENGPQNFQTSIINNLDVLDGITGYIWFVQSVADGSYRVRILPDGKETLGKSQSQLPCFADGEAMPGSSGLFKVARAANLVPKPDRFPPNTSGATIWFVWKAFFVIIIVHISVAWIQ